MKRKETTIDKILQSWRMAKVKKYITTRGVVCDLGCGNEGAFLNKISSIIENGIGFDIEIEEKKDRNIIFKKADLNDKVSQDDNSCDYVVSLAVIEHVDNYDNFIGEIFRILKKEGTCLLTTPAPKVKTLWERLVKLRLINQSKDIHEHKKYFQGFELENLFKKTGFSYVKSTEFQLGFNNFLIAKK